MCHLILLLPIVALPVFWMMPPSLSIPVYASTLVVSGWAYTFALKALRLPQVTDDARLKAAVGKVTSIETRGRCHVEILGELWQGESQDHLNTGDPVRITGRNGLRLRVERYASAKPG